MNYKIYRLVPSVIGLRRQNTWQCGDPLSNQYSCPHSSAILSKTRWNKSHSN